MSHPQVVAVAPESPAARAGLVPGDEILAIEGQVPRDVIAYRLLVDAASPELEVQRGNLTLTLTVAKAEGEALGAEVHSAVFDQIRTCDNHCEFCFIYQLPKGLRPSLYLKDDDYRLSFLYGNFTTLTRFTEADLERVVTEGLSPLNVSIHTTDPELRARMLRNRRGATSLRWLRALLDHGIAVHGQIVVCPGVNDGDALDATLAGVLDQYPELASLCVVPLGVSRYSHEASLRPHTSAEAAAVVDVVEDWQGVYLEALGRRLAFAADEYYLLAGRQFPDAEAYEGFPMHEDGVGMARAFEAELLGAAQDAIGVRPGFFSWVDGAPAEGYRAVRVGDGSSGKPGSMAATAPVPVPALGSMPMPVMPDPVVGSALAPSQAQTPVALLPSRQASVGILTGEYGARVLGPLLDALGCDRTHVRLVPVPNRFFGGNIAVTGLMVGDDIARVLEKEPAGHRYLLPDVCLSGGVFLDGRSLADLPRPVEVIRTDGVALRQALLGGRP